MRLYLMRHGEADLGREDELRELTPLGRDEIARLAERCAAAGVAVEEIRHSPLVRARASAEILAARLRPVRGLVEDAGIGPEGDPDTAAVELGLLAAPVLLVTHMPFVSRLEGRLVTGRRGAAGAAYATGELHGFELTGGRWERTIRLDGEA